LLPSIDDSSLRAPAADPSRNLETQEGGAAICLFLELSHLRVQLYFKYFLQPMCHRFSNDLRADCHDPLPHSGRILFNSGRRLGAATQERNPTALPSVLHAPTNRFLLGCAPQINLLIKTRCRSTQPTDTFRASPPYSYRNRAIPTEKNSSAKPSSTAHSCSTPAGPCPRTAISRKPCIAQ